MYSSQSKYLRTGTSFNAGLIFHHKMEIVLQLRNYSYYTSSETVYIQGTVLIKKELLPPVCKQHYFEGVKKGSKLNLKFACSDPEKVKILLTERVVKIISNDVFIPDDLNKSHSFIVNELQQCEI